MGSYDMVNEAAGDPMINCILSGRYVIRQRIGKGAAGAVYLATRCQDDSAVAVKLLHPDLMANTESIKRFQEEAKAAASLVHRHIVRLVDVGIAPTGQPYLVMDYLAGESLAQRLASVGPLDMRTALSTMRQTCEALTEAHNHGILHRDVKPANIMLITRFDQRNFVVVVDFSVSKLITRASDVDARSAIFGTPTYMSPERFLGEAGDFRSDIYAMGITMYQMLAGTPPFTAIDRQELMNQHLRAAPPLIATKRNKFDVPDTLEATIFRALSKDKEDRQENMRQLLTEVEEIEREWFLHP